MYPSREDMAKVIGTHGKREVERDGRLSGTIIVVEYPRRDGKFPVTYVFGGGDKRIRKLYTLDQCQEAISKLRT